MNKEGVYVKKTRGGKMSFERRRGSFIDRVATSIPLEGDEENIETLKVNEEDSKNRRDLNKVIADFVVKNSLKQGLTMEQIVDYISEKFPEESKASIQTKIEHWQQKYEYEVRIIDNWVEQIKSGKKTTTSVDDSLRGLYSKYKVLRKSLQAYYESRLKEISDMEEER